MNLLPKNIFHRPKLAGASLLAVLSLAAAGVLCVSGLGLYGVAQAQSLWPPVPQQRPAMSNGFGTTIATSNSTQFAAENPITVAPIATTSTPSPGDLLFSFSFANASVLDIRQQLVARDQGEVDGVLLPSQLLFDPRQYSAVVVRLLDKITTELETRTVGVGQETSFGTLTLSVEACLKNPSNKTPESTSYVKILDYPPNKEPVERFSGWMFASSPALNALDHAIYDVWVIDCVNVPLG